jgi:hypothetical protein
MADALVYFAAYKRTGFPEAIALNCISEAAPTMPSATTALIARPGLENFATVGTAPIRGVFQKAGLIGGDAFIVANDTCYRVTSGGAVTALTGTIPGSGLVEIDGGLDADYNSIIRIATGSALYKYDSSGLAVVAETFPDSGNAGATSVAFFGGYWAAPEAGSDALYYQIPAASTWSALDFASAEYAPDPLVGVRAFGELLALFGSATTEFWRLTGNASSPLEPAGGLKFDIGCRAIASAVNMAGTLVWVDDNCSVNVSDGGPPSVISDSGLSEQIRNTAAADLSASYFIVDQHPLYVLHLGTTATWVYDLSTKRWSNFLSLGYDYWRPRFFANLGGTVLATDRLSSQLYRLDPDRRTDGSTVFPLEFMAVIDVPEGAADIGNVELDCLTGDAPRTGQGSDPLIGLRWSRDRGATWSDARYRSLGATGKNAETVRWTALGQARAPYGLMLKFEVSDPVGRRFSAVRVNVP